MKKIICISLVIFCLFSTSLLQAQEVKEKIVYRPIWIWCGLKEKQPDAEIPKGNAPFQQSERVTKETKSTLLKPSGVGEWELTNGWELTEAHKIITNGANLFNPQLNTAEWYNATVPGTVLTTLVNQGVYPNPYFGLNNLAIPDILCRMDWWYRIKFVLPDEAKNKATSLLFNGINYRAEIYLNGTKLGNIDGAFRRGRFDISNAVKTSGENVLAVHILPPNNPGIPNEQSMIAGQGYNGGQLCYDGPTFIAAEGWDWIPGIRDRNIGIWQDVRLQTTGAVRLIDPQIITDLPLPDTSKANISVLVTLKNESNQAVSGILNGKMENGAFQQAYSLAAGERKKITFTADKFPMALALQHPRLWWPNGYGSQALYTMTLTVEDDKQKVSDEKNIRFGVREMSYEMMIDFPEQPAQRVEFNPLSALKNGVPIFDNEKRREYKKDIFIASLREGVDYTLLKNLSNDDPVGPYLVIKVNGVRIFCRGGNWGMDDAMKNVSRTKLEPYFRLHKEEHFNIIRNWTGENTEKTFYDLCDEYGMLVWNDFWLTTENSNVDPNDFSLFVDNATDVVRRFRNHPSIAVWCPRNEGFAPKGLENLLHSMCVREDPTRHYHGQSRYLNMRGSGPWNHFANLADYYTNNAQGFNTEMGCFSVPTANTIRKFIAPEDLWPINDVWAYHDLHHKSQGFTEFMADVYRYGQATGFEDFCRKAQFVNYEAWRAMLEAWNQNMWNDCTGLILWMSHPAWPSMIWQTYSWDYETHASFYGAKKACEPLHIQMNLDDNRVVIVNTSLQSHKQIKASVKLFDLKGKQLFAYEEKYDSPANERVNCFIPVFPKNLPNLYLVRVELKNEKGNILSQNDYWKTNGEKESYQQFNQLKPLRLQAQIKIPKFASLKTKIIIRNPGKEMAVNIKLNLRSKATDEIMLPAYFSDGYFHLLPGESREIAMDTPEGEMNWYVSAEGYNVPLVCF